MDNEDCAERGRQVLEDYVNEIAPDECHDMDVWSLADLLADLRHFCNQNDIDFQAALDMSEYHFVEEIAGR